MLTGRLVDFALTCFGISYHCQLEDGGVVMVVGVEHLAGVGVAVALLYQSQFWNVAVAEQNPKIAVIDAIGVIVEIFATEGIPEAVSVARVGALVVGAEALFGNRLVVRCSVLLAISVAVVVAAVFVEFYWL